MIPCADTTILGNAQTYMGVLATFIVLCLFISKKDEETSNFIMYLMLKIRGEIIMLIDDHTKNLWQDIRTTHNFDKISDLINSHNCKLDKKMDLIDIQFKVDMQKQLFFRKAENYLKSFEPESTVREKEELSYVALFTMLLIVMVMLIDCTSLISIGLRAAIINMALITSCIWLCVLYHKFYQFASTVKDKPEDTSGHPNFLLMLAIMAFGMFLWIGFSIVINTPLFSLIFYALIMVGIIMIFKKKWISINHVYNRYTRVLFYQFASTVKDKPEDTSGHPNFLLMLAIMAFGMFLWIGFSIVINTPLFSLIFYALIMVGIIMIFKKKWISINHVYNRYTRVFTINHFWYIMAFALCAVLSIHTLNDCMPKGDYHSNISALYGLVSDPSVAKYFSIIFFSLNGFFLPIIIGYLYLRRRHNRINASIDELKEKVQSEAESAAADLKEIQEAIETAK